MKAAKLKKNLKEMPSPQQKKLLKRKRNNITPLKINVPISQTSSESLKLTIQTYQMRNKKLKMKFGQLQEEISKASLPVSVDLRNDIKSFILDSDQKNLPHMRLSSKNIYNLLKIMLHFIRDRRFPWLCDVFPKSFPRLAEFFSAMPRKLYKTFWPENVHFVANI